MNIPESMRIGLIADTHNHLRPEVLQHFKGVDYILHAGDVGEYQLLSRLHAVAPVIAIRGNTDVLNSCRHLPEFCQMKIAGLQILTIHDIEDPQLFSERLNNDEFSPTPQLVLFGHTHRLFYEQHGPYIFINPGSASNSRNERPPTVIILTIIDGTIQEYRVIELVSKALKIDD